MITSVIFCLSYALSKELLSPLKWFISTKSVLLSDVVMTLLVPAEIVNTRVFITLFMTIRYPLIRTHLAYIANVKNRVIRDNKVTVLKARAS